MGLAVGFSQPAFGLEGIVLCIQTLAIIKCMGHGRKLHNLPDASLCWASLLDIA